MCKEGLTLNDLCLSYQSNGVSNEILKNISFHVDESEFVSIIGPNGCGKSSMLNIIAGINQSTSGDIKIDGKEIFSPGIDRALIMQDFGLFDWMTVYCNIAFGLTSIQKNKLELKKTTNHWIQKLRLEGFEKYYPFELSGGMKQKVAIARALAMDSKILLMDEPFANLDNKSSFELQQIILDLLNSLKKTIIMVTHSIEEAIYLSDRIIVLSDRPTKIKKIISIKSNKPREPSFKFSQYFFEMYEDIIKTIDETEEKGDYHNV